MSPRLAGLTARPSQGTVETSLTWNSLAAWRPPPVLLLVLPAASAYAVDQPRGIDVAKYQHPHDARVDWGLRKASGLSVYVKATAVPPFRFANRRTSRGRATWRWDNSATCR